MKPGYKQTEVGVIPEEWEARTFRQICRVNQGLQVAIEDRLRYPTTTSKTYITIQFLNDRKTIEYINDYPPSACCSTDDVLMTRTGNTGIVVSGVEGVFHNNFFKINFDRRKLDQDFLVGFLSLNSTRKVILEKAGTSTIPDLNHGDFYSIYLPLPPLPEQRAIATALSDVDGLLGGLDRLIAKKRDLKQAAMQQLLTAQTRLPGFHGEWEVKRLKQVAEISTGINKPLSEMGSGALYVTVQDLYDKTSIRTERLSRIKVSPTEIETRGLMLGDIVFGKSSVKRDGIGYPSQFLGCDEPVVFSGFTYRARARQGITDASFLFYALREEKTRRWLIDNSQASALTNINQTIADAIPVQVPPSVSEQIAIASVLRDMDEELAALEQRREKTRALKQAMMQELLTGRTRLV
jgi:type I restriction enzyme S subunit